MRDKNLNDIQPASRLSDGEGNRYEGIGGAVHKCLIQYFNSLQDTSPPQGLYEVIIQEIERPLIQETLNYCHQNQTRAARILGINRNTLHKKIQAYFPKADAPHKNPSKTPQKKNPKTKVHPHK